MKLKTKIFNILFGVLICMAPAGGFAAEDIECGYFNPAFGLCSVHSHNVKYVDNTTGMPTNPTKSEDVALMNEVIALKSTVIAQQLKEQYDQLNAIIKRFKTQLEKAVLTSKIEVATGNAASGNSGGSSANSYGNNVSVSGASDCSGSGYSNESGVAQCLQPNIQLIINTANSGNIGNARKQLKNDIIIAKRWGLCVDNQDTQKSDTCEYTCCDALKKTSVDNADNALNTKDKIANCARDFSAAISRAAQCLANKNYPYYRRY